MVDGSPVYTNGDESAMDINIVGEGQGTKFLNFLLSTFGSLIIRAKRAIKDHPSIPDPGFYIKTLNGVISASDLLELKFEDFELTSKSELTKIHETLKNKLNRISPGLYDRFVAISGDPAAVVKMYVFLDGYLYNAKDASTISFTEDGTYLLPMNVSDPANPKLLLSKLELTITKRSGGSGARGNPTNYYFTISDPDINSRRTYNGINPIERRRRTVERGIQIEDIETLDFSPMWRQRLENISVGSSGAGGFKAKILLSNADGTAMRQSYENRTRKKHLSQVNDIIGNLNDPKANLGQYLTLSSTGEIQGVDFRGILNDPNVDKNIPKLLDIQIIKYGKLLSGDRELTAGKKLPKLAFTAI